MQNMMVPTVLSCLLLSLLKVNVKRIRVKKGEIHPEALLELAKVDPSISVLCDVQVSY